MEVILSIDYSTSATGWSKFSALSGELLEFGCIKQSEKNPTKYGVKKYTEIEFQLRKLNFMADEICKLINEEVKEIVIEEINNGKARLGQKLLSGGHYILLSKLNAKGVVRKITYVDSDGLDGWRSAKGLNLMLSSQDKLLNAERKKANKKHRAYNKNIKNKENKKPLFHIITKKDLACRFVNKHYNLDLNVEKDATHGDIADSVGLGHHFLHYMGGLSGKYTENSAS